MSSQLAGRGIIVGAAILSFIASILVLVILYYTCVNLNRVNLFYALITLYIIAFIFYIVGYGLIGVSLEVISNN